MVKFIWQFDGWMQFEIFLMRMQDERYYFLAHCVSVCQKKYFHLSGCTEISSLDAKLLSSKKKLN